MMHGQINIKLREKLTAEGGAREFQDHTDIMNHESYLNKIQSSASTSQHTNPPLKKYLFFCINNSCLSKQTDRKHKQTLR